MQTIHVSMVRAQYDWSMVQLSLSKTLDEVIDSFHMVKQWIMSYEQFVPMAKLIWYWYVVFVSFIRRKLRSSLSFCVSSLIAVLLSLHGILFGWMGSNGFCPVHLFLLRQKCHVRPCTVLLWIKVTPCGWTMWNVWHWVTVSRRILFDMLTTALVACLKIYVVWTNNRIVRVWLKCKRTG